MNTWRVIFSIVILVFSIEVKAQMEERQSALIKQLQVEYIASFSTDNIVDTAFFDKKGRLIKQISFDDNVLVQKDEFLKFDDKNNCIVETIDGINPNNQQLEKSTLKSTYEYVDTIIVKDEYSSYDSLGIVKYTISKRYFLDEFGKVFQETQNSFYGVNDSILNDSTITTYQYNVQGKISKEFVRSYKTPVGFDRVKEYQYDKLGQLIEEKTLHSFESYERSVFEFNEKGLLSKMTVYGSGLGSRSYSPFIKTYEKEQIIRIYSTFYDANGLISKTITEENGTESITQFKYKFYK